MKKQIVFIHGGHTYSSYDDFVKDLRTGTIHDPFLEPPLRWTRQLYTDLGGEYEVCAPTMPNNQNAQYEEWKTWFERFFEFLHSDVILIGWSLGGIFLAKYLSENTAPCRARALFLVAPVASFEDFEGGKHTSFSFDFSDIHNLDEQVGDVTIFHSQDDFVVPYEHGVRYRDALPNAEMVTFENKGHFLIEEFPELIEKLKNVR